MEREDIFKYVYNKYKVKPDYPLPSAPDFPVLRHKDNQKWFALIMNISTKKLGLDSDESTDIINVKLSDPLLADMISQQKGYFRGYHIQRGNWISIILDGSVPFNDICHWIDESYNNTARRNQWLIPANPKYYDIEHAFDNSKEIDWKQGKGIKTNDTIYIYAASPISAILYKCKVIKTNIPFTYSDKNLTIDALMKIRLLKKYNRNLFTIQRLKDEYDIFAIRGPRGVPNHLIEALNRKGKT